METWFLRELLPLGWRRHVAATYESRTLEIAGRCGEGRLRLVQSRWVVVVVVVVVLVVVVVVVVDVVDVVHVVDDDDDDDDDYDDDDDDDDDVDVVDEL